MPKPKNEFCNQFVVARLIQEVKIRPCLWNTTDKNKNDRQYIAAAWEEISRILDISEFLVRNKWRNIRSFFKKIVRKYGVRDVNDYTGGWCHFTSLWFINQPDLPQNDGDSSDEATNTSNELVNCEPVEFSETEVLTEEPVPIPENKRATNSGDNDHDQMFLRSLTPYFKQLEPIRKLVIRNKIQEVLLKELATQKNSSDNFY